VFSKKVSIAKKIIGKSGMVSMRLPLLKTTHA